MKLKSIITLGAFSLAIAGSGWARTWTSADGKNTFEGEFVSATDTKVTVKKSGRNISFDIAKLSTDDQAFVEQAVKDEAAKAEALAKSEKLKSSLVPKEISGKLVKLDGKRLKKASEPEVVPEFYFLAYSASW